MKFYIKYLFFMSTIVLFYSCRNSASKNEIIDLQDSTSNAVKAGNNKTEPVYIAIASMTSPKETFSYYGDLIYFISKKAGHPIYIKQKKTYEEVNKLLENGEVDFAFICSGAYVEGYAKHHIKLLVAPQIDNKVSYHAYIITQKAGNINSFADFKDKSFAFSDPLSNTGRLYPQSLLLHLGQNEANFFLKTMYTYGHDISIQVVNQEIINGASVHGLIFDYIKQKHPESVSNIKIIGQSEEYGMPPVVVPVSLKKECFEKYRNIFLNIHKDSAGVAILNKLRIDKFVVVDKSLYKSVFELKEYIDNAQNKMDN